ncbi:hypothetical protein MBM_08350 [Drepanopeziza brunnea f. sp. 'multigermtubi' MB_m1]|uniref:Uncharacterized protein n=1 Tax=Marssonina brunnea f. sp. multigermtubi (strain MB_m1) TaxID=1072389 RepID=K1WMU5_MARBU|nr:uncharacterized protein MBM_08350 [Drepanopeziza brunnea f. sp. 'multigermtubi' MB_m1]EKD13632.1 hypothetical protein MBM_08350 [Drepanopeziza brunnea f. sp. 'multigermtubi' MB_m1]
MTGTNDWVGLLQQPTAFEHLQDMVLIPLVAYPTSLRNVVLVCMEQFSAYQQALFDASEGQGDTYAGTRNNFSVFIATMMENHSGVKMRNGVTFGIEEGKGPETSFLATTRIWERVLKKSNIERQLAAVLEYARDGNVGAGSLLNSIAANLEDQMLRFETWSSDVDAKTGTLGEEPFPGAFSDDANWCFGLVKERLLKILELAGRVSDGLSAVFGVLRDLIAQRLQVPGRHVSRTISEIDPVLQSLDVMVRQVLQSQAVFRKKSNYWEHRQKILQANDAGRSSGPSDLPTPSPSRTSNESPSSISYPDRIIRPEIAVSDSDKGKGPEDVTRRTSIPEITHSSLADRAIAKPKGSERTWQGKPPPINSQISVAYQADRLKAKLEMLLERHFHDKDWIQKLDNEISVILDEESLRAMFNCSCEICIPARGLATSSSNRGGELQLDGVGDSLRLLATCILAEKPFLIILLLSVDIDDDAFEECKSETQLVGLARIALVDARILLQLKGLFFGVGIMRYLRSSRKEDIPQEAERAWILTEILELTRKLSFPTDAFDEEIRDMMIGQLTFATTAQMATDRTISSQSLGFIIMDMIWFLLAQAFEVAYILIQPTGRLGLNGTPGENYAYADLHLRRLWTVEAPGDSSRGLDRSRNKSLDASTKETAGEIADLGNYVEMGRMSLNGLSIARYKKEGVGEVEAGCRIRIYKSPNRQRMRFVICGFEKDPNRHTSFQALTENLIFVPLYCYGSHPGEFSAKLQPKSGSTKDINIPYIFTFQRPILPTSWTRTLFT